MISYRLVVLSKYVALPKRIFLASINEIVIQPSLEMTEKLPVSICMAKFFLQEVNAQFFPDVNGPFFPNMNGPWEAAEEYFAY